MAKVYILCGKICSGKSTYSQQLRKDKKAVILSVDDITSWFLKDNKEKIPVYDFSAENPLVGSWLIFTISFLL